MGVFSVYRKLSLIVALLAPVCAWAQSPGSPHVNNLTVDGTIIGGTISGSNASGANVTVPNGQARSLSAIANDRINVLNVLPQTSPATDYTAVLLGLAAVPQVTVYLPNTGTPYRISGNITIVAPHVTLLCDPGTIIQSSSTAGRMIDATASYDAVQNCMLDGQSLGVGWGHASSDHFSWVGGGGKNAGSFVFSGASYGLVRDTSWTNSNNSGIIVGAGSSFIDLIHNDFEGNINFGISFNGGSHDNLAEANWTIGGGRELLGADSTTFNNRWIGNRATGTGDNCFSMTGSYSTITGNQALGCAFSGIGVFGSFNTVVGNVVKNNGQCQNPAYPYYNASCGTSSAGINVFGGFGGAAQNNTVSGNIVDDDQAVPTQNYGLRIRFGYTQWLTDTTYPAQTYIYNAGNIYESPSTPASQVSGASAPTCTSGTCSDGTILWTYISTTPNTSNDASGNVIGQNNLLRAAIAPYNDTSTGHNNAVANQPCILHGSTNPNVSPPDGCLWQRDGASWDAGLYQIQGGNWGSLANLGGAATTFSGCGTSPTVIGISATTARGLIAEGAGATGCVVTFHDSQGGNIPTCLVTWLPGGLAPTVVITATAITLTNPTGTFTNPQFSYWCMK